MWGGGVEGEFEGEVLQENVREVLKEETLREVALKVRGV